MTLNKTTKVMALAFTMFAMTGMLGFTGNPAFAEPGKGGASEGPKGVGKGGYQLNLIGQDRTTDADCTNKGHRIHVPLSGSYRILLTEGPFRVLDCNALDSGNKVGSFQLPDPDPDDLCDGSKGSCTVVYQVWVRVLGQPGKTLTAVTCGIDPGDGTTEICSTETLTVESANGPHKKAKFTNATKELLTLCLVFDAGTGKCTSRIALFDDELQGYFWDFDSDGVRLAQLRFIQESFDVPA